MKKQSKMSELKKKMYYIPSDPGSLGGKERLKHSVLRIYITQNHTCQIQT